MSAGLYLPEVAAAAAAEPTPTVCATLDCLAPAMQRALAACAAEWGRAGLDAIVYESCRSRELQQLYYARGRTVKPPSYTVTNAPDETYSWHGYGLAVDVIHRVKRWGVSEAWYREVARIAARHGLRWGGEWKHPDLPHFQWHRCKPSPSARARELLASGGRDAVWREVQAA